ncbi:protein of unknown function [Kyrpidia spormannii]|uniref:Uncharacterized protein n=1 Tax=Kyrpidia spormannii TaxID=2055160 RepID=A0ACA8Z5M8_9BACL|nr:protein of unknown function [Kyrpidia spormannii]
MVRDGSELHSLGTGLPLLACRTREEAHAEKRAHPGGGSLPDGRRQRSGRQRLLDRFGQIFRQLLIPPTERKVFIGLTYAYPLSKFMWEREPDD